MSDAFMYKVLALLLLFMVFYTNVLQNKLHLNVNTFSTTLSAVVLFLMFFLSNIFEVKS
jgi:hypothetical protein